MVGDQPRRRGRDDGLERRADPRTLPANLWPVNGTHGGRRNGFLPLLFVFGLFPLRELPVEMTNGRTSRSTCSRCSGGCSGHCRRRRRHRGRGIAGTILNRIRTASYDVLGTLRKRTTIRNP